MTSALPGTVLRGCVPIGFFVARLIFRVLGRDLGRYGRAMVFSRIPVFHSRISDGQVIDGEIAPGCNFLTRPTPFGQKSTNRPVIRQSHRGRISYRDGHRDTLIFSWAANPPTHTPNQPQSGIPTDIGASHALG